MDFDMTAEHEQLREAARRLAEEKFAPKAFTWTSFPWENAGILARAGFTGITIPTSDGGQGGSLLDAAIVLEEISRLCPHTGDVVQATNFGAIRQVAMFGTSRVKREVLPPLLAGAGLISSAMSEPEAGSALTTLTTRAQYDGDKVVLTGQKAWTSNAHEATHLLVWCRFGPRTRDIGCVVVPTALPGVECGPAEHYMSGERYAPVTLAGCRVPRDYVLVEHDALGKMLTTFGVERIGNAIRSMSLARAAFERAVEYAKVRTQFGRPLCEFQGLQWKFADMRVKLDAMRLLIYRAAAHADRGAPSPAETSIAKCYTNEASFEIASQALQIFGALGYSAQYPMEYYVRRTRGWMIAGGSVEMLRNHIAADVFGRRFSQRDGSSRITVPQMNDGDRAVERGI